MPYASLLGSQPILNSGLQEVFLSQGFRVPGVETPALDQLLEDFTQIVEPRLQLRSAFVPVTSDELHKLLATELPKHKIIPDIVDDAPQSKEFVAQCVQLRSAGYRVCVDASRGVPSNFEQLLPAISFVRVRYPADGNTAHIAKLLDQAQERDVKLLCYGVDTPEAARQCRELGVTLTQGLHFTKPTGNGGTRATVLELLALIYRDASNDDIARHLKKHLQLAANLLRVVNSAAFSFRTPLASLPQALMVLGRVKLLRSLQILLFAGDSANGLSGPLLRTVAARARFMELCGERLALDVDHQGQAFSVGILSLVGAITQQSVTEVAALPGLSDEVIAALLRREGILGEILHLAEFMLTTTEVVPDLFHQLGSEVINDLYWTAQEWANSVGAEK